MWNKTIALFIASGLVILVGTIVMYNIESQVPNSKIKTLLDALWWCVSAVTTVGNRDIVPVSDIERIVALFYMFFWYTWYTNDSNTVMRHHNTFYKKRFEKEEREKREPELNNLKNELIQRLSHIEEKTVKMY